MLLRPRGRHAKPSKAAPVLAAGGLTATLGLLDAGALTTAAHASYARGSDTDFTRLRACESGGRYGIDTGNGFYGAYQFDLGTWHSLGYGGNPADAAPQTQDAAAHQLQANRGWQPWPSCSRQLGLSSHGGSAAPERASRTRHTIAGRPAASPAFAGHVLTVKDVAHRRADVTAWQRRMSARGWDIAIDGHFGPQSAGVARRFAAEKHLTTTHGTVDQVLWDAAWRTPVS